MLTKSSNLFILCTSSYVYLTMMMISKEAIKSRQKELKKVVFVGKQPKKRSGGWNPNNSERSMGTNKMVK